MTYVTSEDYSDELLELASSKVDDLTLNRIHVIGYNNLTEFQRDLIERATIAQAEYYNTYGTDAGAINSFSIGDVSMDISSNDTNYRGASLTTIMLLRQTGLMYRGGF